MADTTHDGETLAEAIARLKLVVTRPFTRHPEARGRLGWKDLLGGHALVNIPVSYAREYPQMAGKIWMATTGVALVALTGYAL